MLIVALLFVVTSVQAVRDTSLFGMHWSESFHDRLYDLSYGSFDFDRRMRAIFPSLFKAGVRPQIANQSRGGDVQDWFGKGADQVLVEIVLCEAIRNHQTLKVRYRTTPDGQGWRRMVPVMLAVGDNGTDILFGYQLDGSSASGKQRGWKRFKTARLMAGVVYDEKPPATPEFRQPDSVEPFCS